MLPSASAPSAEFEVAFEGSDTTMNLWEDSFGSSTFAMEYSGSEPWHQPSYLTAQRLA